MTAFGNQTRPSSPVTPLSSADGTRPAPVEGAFNVTFALGSGLPVRLVTVNATARESWSPALTVAVAFTGVTAPGIVPRMKSAAWPIVITRFHFPPWQNSTWVASRPGAAPALHRVPARTVSQPVSATADRSRIIKIAVIRFMGGNRIGLTPVRWRRSGTMTPNPRHRTGGETDDQ